MVADPDGTLTVSAPRTEREDARETSERTVYLVRLELAALDRELRTVSIGDPRGPEIVEQIRALEVEMAALRDLSPFDPSGL